MKAKLPRSLPPLLALLALLCFLGGQIFAAEITKTLDVPYATMAGVEAGLLSLDVHAPKGARGAPVIVFFHGGGWRRGDKAGEGALSQARFYTAHGWIYVSANYRLSPAVAHPAHAEDAARALAFVHAHAAEWGGDATRIFVSARWRYTEFGENGAPLFDHDTDPLNSTTSPPIRLMPRPWPSCAPSSMPAAKLWNVPLRGSPDRIIQTP